MAPSCSSIASIESSSDEVTFEFMRRFVSILFTDSLGISLELKHQFGQYARVSWPKKNLEKIKQEQFRIFHTARLRSNVVRSLCKWSKGEGKAS
jgi:hypothetical protein